MLERILNRIKHYQAPIPDYKEIYDIPDRGREGKRLQFGFGAGRCGMRWMNKVFISHDTCSGACERFVAYEPFYRYVTWNRLPIDLIGFYQVLENSIRWDWERADLAFISSPYMSFGMQDIIDRFKPDNLFFHIRKPEDTINSLYVKGWYDGDPIYNDKSLALGPQPMMMNSLSHHFSRILPRENEYDEWLSLSRIGRITWFYVTINQWIFDHLKKYSHIPHWIMKLSDVDQNYDYYMNLTKEFGLNPVMKKEDFLQLKGKMPNQAKSRRSSSDWSKEEKRDFEKVIGSFYDFYDSLKTTGL